MAYEDPASIHTRIDATGRNGLDYSNSRIPHQTNLIQSKFKKFTISTYNVRTLLQIGKFHQLTSGCHRFGLDFVAVQEHRWQTKYDIESVSSDDNNYRFVYSSADCKGNGGVGLLIQKGYANQIKSIKKISSRILLVAFDCNPQLVVFSVYSPTDMASDTDKEAFYNTLYAAIINIPPHCLLIVAGDFNARIGRHSHPDSARIIGNYTFYEHSNDNGERLVELCETSLLRPLQGHFSQSAGRQYSWQHPGGEKHLIDHILLRAKWMNSARSCRSFSTVELDSDHRIVSALIKVSLRRPRKTAVGKPKYDWQSLINNAELQTLYNIEIQNNFGALYDLNTNESTQNKYNNFVTCIANSNERTLDKIKHKKHSWVSSQTEQLCEERNLAKNKYKKTKTIGDYNNWRKLCKKVTTSFKKDKEIHYTNLGHQANKAKQTNNIKQVYQIVNQISGKFRKNTAAMAKKRDGGSPESIQDSMIEWGSWFKEILNKDAKINTRIKKSHIDLPINTDNFTEEEIKVAINSLKNGKAAGIDKDITAEALKMGGNITVSSLCDICNSVFNKNDPPSEWTTNIIIPIPKKISTEMSDFRGISLMSISAKVYNKVILNRIYEQVNQKLTSNQTGFRKNMNTIQHIQALRRIIEGATTKQLPLITTFIDFRRAFDSINRTVMWKILRLYGIPEKIVNAIKCLYTNSKFKVSIGDYLSESYESSSGIRAIPCHLFSLLW